MLLTVSTALLFGCASASSDELKTDEEALRRGKAGEGEACGDGAFGRPMVECRSGLECVTPETDGPSGPPGAAGSAHAGRCEARADEGDTCGDGAMGRPNIACRTGLSCVTPRGVSGPAGAHGSLRLGHCEPQG
ncbi:MAG: hypothetical protein IPG50_33640 [Myxococcales bacterium]|nr:hypothetical protein [Myxococcales bacterium]